MAGIKKLTTRIINKHATAEVWHKSNFKPLQAEVIIYDPGYDPRDGKTYTCERQKIGDGTHTVNELPFADEKRAVVTKSETATEVVTSVGSPTYVSASYTAPSMGQLFADNTLTVTFDAGSYTPATLTPGTVETSTVRYLSDVTVDVETPHYTEEN